MKKIVILISLILGTSVSHADYLCHSASPEEHTTLTLIDGGSGFSFKAFEAVGIAKNDGDLEILKGDVTHISTRVEVYDSYKLQNENEEAIAFAVKEKPIVLSEVPQFCGRGACDIDFKPVVDPYPYQAVIDLKGESLVFECKKTFL
ncbi:MAG: hypothetical protein HRT44_02525 [Bdellovibrionales bacterium]|nr:hypothetical protein [Bdellovibrionales bacterium]NQZ18123.1 hypothetical protein [Bdellovibrionales bacterium]